ncbi:hypothetical protein D3C80_1776170 [compost metagenome]
MHAQHHHILREGFALGDELDRLGLAMQFAQQTHCWREEALHIQLDGGCAAAQLPERQ